MKSLKEFINEELQNSNTVIHENKEQVSENSNAENQEIENTISENVENQEAEENK